MKPITTARVIRIHPSDNVVIATEPLVAGTSADMDGATLTLATDVPAGHKVAISDIPASSEVIKFGFPIGVTTTFVKAGS